MGSPKTELGRGDDEVQHEVKITQAYWLKETYAGNSDGKTHPVKGKAPNAWGLYDMLGNVWEWSWDWEADYGTGDQKDPVGPSTGSRRVVRGGSWYNDAWVARAAYRFDVSPGYRVDNLGFRTARSIP